jgi:hypothetical protein
MNGNCLQGTNCLRYRKDVTSGILCELIIYYYTKLLVFEFACIYERTDPVSVSRSVLVKFCAHKCIWYSDGCKRKYQYFAAEIIKA